MMPPTFIPYTETNWSDICILVIKWGLLDTSVIRGGWEFDFPLCLLNVEPPCVTLGNLHSPREPPEESNGKLLLSILYLKNSGKGNHKSELT